MIVLCPIKRAEANGISWPNLIIIFIVLNKTSPPQNVVWNLAYIWIKSENSPLMSLNFLSFRQRLSLPFLMSCSVTKKFKGCHQRLTVRRGRQDGARPQREDPICPLGKLAHVYGLSLWVGRKFVECILCAKNCGGSKEVICFIPRVLGMCFWEMGWEWRSMMQYQSASAWLSMTESPMSLGKQGLLL